MANLPLLEQKSKLVLTGDFEKTIGVIKAQKSEQTDLYVYPNTSILVDDIKNITHHAYIASENEQYMILTIEAINTISQNALLKILEEPPVNIYFLILARNKNIFLPTVLSRLMVIRLFSHRYHTQAFKYDIAKMSLAQIFAFVKDNKNMQKKEASDMLYSLFNHIYDNNLNLPQKHLDLLSQSVILLHLNSKPIHVLANTLLQLEQYFTYKARM